MRPESIKRRVAVGVTAAGLDLVMRAIGNSEERRGKSTKEIATAVLDAIGITDVEVESLECARHFIGDFHAHKASKGEVVEGVFEWTGQLKNLENRIDRLRPPVRMPEP